ncbi:phosphatase PAP2 family protein [Candidatus Woesearchaeota archaeon]|nr:MAG: phosphatase PAP2 family protein [Candidatus Woesearchaeota archaeon]
MWIKLEKKKVVPLVYGLITTFVVVYLMKEIIMRPRPYMVLSIVPVVKNFTSYSFPSMHAALAFAFLPTLNRIFKNKVLWSLVVGGVAISRVYLGVHYLSDVIAGALIGYVISNQFWKLLNKKSFRPFIFVKNDR